MLAIIPLSRGFFSLIDKEDENLVKKWNWSYVGGYARRQSKGRTYSMHREILGLTGSSFPFVDHINGDKLDNRKSNLRLCNESQNSANTKLESSNTTGFRGVSLDKNFKVPKYRAVITFKNKQYYLGSYQTKEEAAIAYNIEAVKLFGEFAYQNKVGKS